MKTIKVLGTGCPSCVNTEKVIAEVIKENNIKAELIKVTDIQEIMAYDILSTPAVVIDEKVVVKGRVPSKEEMKQLLLNDEACCSSDDDTCCQPSEENKTNCC